MAKKKLTLIEEMEQEVKPGLMELAEMLKAEGTPEERAAFVALLDAVKEVVKE